MIASQKIMVVEDDRNINEVVSEYLKDSGYTVISVDNGRTARELIMDGVETDLFILDIMLPHTTGLELLKLIRNESRYQRMPVIILTALGDEYTQIISFDSLADDYVNKPFSPKILVKRVQALLRRSGNPNGKMRFGNITIDIDSYEAYEQNEKVILTLREFELLKVLIINRGKVLTRQCLLDTVWGYDFFGDERIVDVHIKNLRKKFSGNIIVTVKGVGYRAAEVCEFD